jgi:hypothetical protein
MNKTVLSTTPSRASQVSGNLQDLQPNILAKPGKCSIKELDSVDQTNDGISISSTEDSEDSDRTLVIKVKRQPQVVKPDDLGDVVGSEKPDDSDEEPLTRKRARQVTANNIFQAISRTDLNNNNGDDDDDDDDDDDVPLFQSAARRRSSGKESHTILTVDQKIAKTPPAQNPRQLVRCNIGSKDDGDDDDNDNDSDLEIVAIYSKFIYQGNITPRSGGLKEPLSISKSKKRNSIDSLRSVPMTPNQSRQKFCPPPNVEIILIDPDDEPNNYTEQSAKISLPSNASSSFAKTKAPIQQNPCEESSSSGNSSMNNSSVESKIHASNYHDRGIRLSVAHNDDCSLVQSPITVPKKRKMTETEYNISHQQNMMKKSREKPSIPDEQATLFVPTRNGSQVVQNGPMAIRPAPPNRSSVTESHPSMVRSVSLTNRSGSQVHPSHFIPMLCPYFTEKGSCWKGSSCFFYHLHDRGFVQTFGLRQASKELFQQAENESRSRGTFELKFGFFCEPSVCNFWKTSSCYRSDEDCWNSHWTSKIWETCYFFTTAKGCRESQELCDRFHFRGPHLPVSKLSSKRFGNASTSVPRHPSSIDTTTEDNRAIEQNEESRQRYSLVSNDNDEHITQAPDSDINRSSILSNDLPSLFNRLDLAEMQMQLKMREDITMRITIRLPRETGTSTSSASFHLRSCVPAKLVHEFLNTDNPIVYGYVQCCEEYRQLALLAEHLEQCEAGAVLSIVGADILITPAEQSTWDFLPFNLQDNGRRERSKLRYHVYNKGILPDTNQCEGEVAISPLNSKDQPVDVSADSSIVDFIDGALSLTEPMPCPFFSWYNTSKPLPKEVHLIPWPGWGAEKQLITLYFQASGARVYDLYQDLLDTKSGGVIIFHASFPIGIVQLIPGFSTVLMKKYNIYQIGTNPRTKEFEFKHLFQNGNAFLLTPKLLEKDPKFATRVMLDIKRVNLKRQSTFNWTWKLVRREKIVLAMDHSNHQHAIKDVDVDGEYLLSLITKAREKKLDCLRLLM